MLNLFVFSHLPLTFYHHLHAPLAVYGAPWWHHRDLPQDLCPVYRPSEWEQLPAEQDLNPFSRYEALDPKRPIVLDDLETGIVTCV